MIRVNLIPHDKRPIEKVPVPLASIFVIGAVSILAALGLTFMQFMDLEDKKSGLNDKRTESEKLNKFVAEADKLQKERDSLEEEDKSIGVVAKRAVFWNEVVYEVCQLAANVDGLVLTEVAVLGEKEILPAYKQVDTQAKVGPTMGIKIVANAYDIQPETILKFRKLVKKSEMLKQILPVINDVFGWKDKKGTSREAPSIEFEVFLFSDKFQEK